MMISLFFPFIFLNPPLIISGFFSDPPSRDVDLAISKSCDRYIELY